MYMMKIKLKGDEISNNMKEYRFDDIKIGMRECFKVTITNEKKDMFEMLSGDRNPMHKDEEYAKSKGFENVLVYGMLVSSYFSTLVGMYIPGKYCLLQSIDNIIFHNPVYIGDELTIEGCIVEKDDRFSRVGIKGIIRGREGKKVCSAKVYVGVVE